MGGSVISLGAELILRGPVGALFEKAFLGDAVTGAQLSPPGGLFVFPRD